MYRIKEENGRVEITEWRFVRPLWVFFLAVWSAWLVYRFFSRFELLSAMMLISLAMTVVNLWDRRVIVFDRNRRAVTITESGVTRSSRSLHTFDEIEQIELVESNTLFDIRTSIPMIQFNDGSRVKILEQRYGDPEPYQEIYRKIDDAIGGRLMGASPPQIP